jgi:hypothetical protein
VREIHVEERKVTRGRRRRALDRPGTASVCHANVEGKNSTIVKWHRGRTLSESAAWHGARRTAGGESKLDGPF